MPLTRVDNEKYVANIVDKSYILQRWVHFKTIIRRILSIML